MIGYLLIVYNNLTAINLSIYFFDLMKQHIHIISMGRAGEKQQQQEKGEEEQQLRQEKGQASPSSVECLE